MPDLNDPNTPGPTRTIFHARSVRQFPFLCVSGIVSEYLPRHAVDFLEIYENRNNLTRPNGDGPGVSPAIARRVECAVPVTDPSLENVFGESRCSRAVEVTRWDLLLRWSRRVGGICGRALARRSRRSRNSEREFSCPRTLSSQKSSSPTSDLHSILPTLHRRRGDLRQ